LSLRLNKARQWIERRQRWKLLLDGGLAEELALRHEQLRPEIEGRLRRLEGCLARLPQDQRSLVEGYYYRREDIAQLAGGSGRTVTATYKALQRIRQALQSCIERASDPEGAVP
jgi:RNA polymerase sigma-70 factor (ECF subfamily)